MAGDPLRRGARSGLRGGPRHVGEAGLLQERVRNLLVVARGCPPRCRLGIRIRLLVARHHAVGGDPADRYLIVAGKEPVAGLHRRNGETLAWTKGIGPHSVDGGGGVDEQRVKGGPPYIRTQLNSL